MCNGLNIDFDLQLQTYAMSTIHRYAFKYTLAGECQRTQANYEIHNARTGLKSKKMVDLTEIWGKREQKIPDLARSNNIWTHSDRFESKTNTASIIIQHRIPTHLTLAKAHQFLNYKTP